MGEGFERVGVFGGTFDPIHIGHLVVGTDVRHALDLDKVLYVVANIPWQKAGTRPLTEARRRLLMVEAALANADGLEASGIEVDRGGESYTADTLEALSAQGADELFLIIGADVAGELPTWRHVEVIRQLATLVVVSRPGNTSPPLPGWRVEHVDIPLLEISSTDIRRRVARGEPIENLVPAPVVRLIAEWGLYA